MFSIGDKWKIKGFYFTRVDFFIIIFICVLKVTEPESYNEWDEFYLFYFIFLFFKKRYRIVGHQLKNQ